MALIETVGADDANTYATLAEANAYHASRLYSTVWTAATVTDATREAALTMACRLLDAYPRAWSGAAVDAVQALGWPRSGMLTRNGFAVATTEIPLALKEAQAELARQLIAADRTADNAVINQGITSLKAGSVALSFSPTMTENSFLVGRSIRELNALSAVLPDAVKYLLVPSWLKKDAEDARTSQTLIFSVISTPRCD